jgi:hypothetical protein
MDPDKPFAKVLSSCVVNTNELPLLEFANTIALPVITELSLLAAVFE